MKVNAAYVCALDRPRAKDFYTRLFQRDPVIENERFVFFDVKGFLFGLFDPAVDGEDVTYGNNCILNIEVNDLDSEYTRISAFAEVVIPITIAGNYRIFQVRDSEGNVIEFYDVLTS